MARWDISTYMIIDSCPQPHNPHHSPLTKTFIEDAPWQWIQFPHGWFLGRLVPSDFHCEYNDPPPSLCLYALEALRRTRLMAQRNAILKKNRLKYMLCFAHVYNMQQSISTVPICNRESYIWFKVLHANVLMKYSTLYYYKLHQIVLM